MPRYHVTTVRPTFLTDYAGAAAITEALDDGKPLARITDYEGDVERRVTLAVAHVVSIAEIPDPEEPERKPGLRAV